jgi:ABC-type branched-subunit amino acid transport system ATPase component
MLLDVKGLTVRFGGVEALTNVDLRLARGEVLGLVGANGCGKTTLFNAITGVVPIADGQVKFAGEDIVGVPIHDIARRGIARTNQTARLFTNMTVADNVSRVDRGDGETIDVVLAHMGLDERRDSLAGELSLAEQRRLEIARALARSPRLLLLDEPTSGLSPEDTDAMIGLLAKHVLPGRAAILIEHKLPVLSVLCPQAILLAQGRVAGVGRPARLFESFGNREGKAC